MRQWCLTCVHMETKEWRRRRPRGGNTWHLDEVVPRIGDQKHSLWPAVEQENPALALWVAEPTHQGPGGKQGADNRQELPASHVPHVFLPSPSTRCVAPLKKFALPVTRSPEREGEAIQFCSDRIPL